MGDTAKTVMTFPTSHYLGISGPTFQDGQPFQFIMKIKQGFPLLWRLFKPLERLEQFRPPTSAQAAQGQNQLVITDNKKNWYGFPRAPLYTSMFTMSSNSRLLPAAQAFPGC
ncbi:hypothetical protein Ddc_18900 [Ditylenchus destructor]|nr:hypothetical protein Ddc_18900 [Ditylenchus destructor]